MAPRTITLCYRKIFDASSARPWEKLVFEDTWREFRMQAQFFTQEKKCRSCAELLQHVPGAKKLPFLVSAAVIGYLQQLNETVPGVVSNLGRHFLKFNQYQFEIIHSDLLDKSRHQVAVNFYSVPVVWHETIGNLLLVSGPEESGGEILTHLFALQPFLSIYSLHTQAHA